MNTPLLSLQNIERSYGGTKKALDDVSLALQPGEIVGLVGPNGAGKTTLLRIAIGILHADRGSVQVFDMDPWKHPVAVKRRIGYVAETQAVPSHMKVQDLIDVHRELFPTWDSDLERDLISRFAMDRSSRIAKLSKGEARRVLLMCAIAHRPELLILDEPAGGLDPAARREFLEVSLDSLHRDGSTILFSSHHMTDIERLAERVAIIDEGTLFLDSDLAALGDYTLVVVPEGQTAATARLQQIDGFVRSRSSGNSTRAVFSRPPEAISAELGALDFNGAHCGRTSLEELFVALMGGKR